MERGQQPDGPGVQFGKYRIVRKLGEGAFGAVFEALLPGAMGFSKRVAIKRLRSDLTTGDAHFVESMINEARIGGMLHHANIVDVFEFDQVDGRYYLAMECVDGATLTEVIALCRKRRVLLPRFAVLDLAMQVCRGLHYAHSLSGPNGPLGLIHRDLKPSNIIVDREGTAKLLDFGIAKAASNLKSQTSTGVAKGTPRYMSPDQLKGRPLLPRSDIFSLGAVLFELLTCRPLFDADSIGSLVFKICGEDLTPSLDEAERVFPGMGEILGRALERDPDKRYQDARALGNDLRVLCRYFPAEADMSEVIGRLLPNLDRTESEIIDSEDLSVEEPHGIPPAPGEVAGAIPTPIPGPGETGSGWGLFTQAFATDGPVDPAALAAMSTKTEIDTAAETRAPLRLEPRHRAGAPLNPGPTREFKPGPPASARPIWRWLLPVLPLAGIGMCLLLPPGPEAGVDEAPTADATPDPDPLADLSQPTPEPPTRRAARQPTPEPATRSAEPSPEPVTRRAATPQPTPRPRDPTPEPRTAAVTPEPATPAVVEPTPAPVLAKPGTISVFLEQWGSIRIDGKVVQRQGMKAVKHPVSGGPHQVVVVRGTDGARHSMTVQVDGQDTSICWDFVAEARCGATP